MFGLEINIVMQVYGAPWHICFELISLNSIILDAEEIC